MRDLKKIVRDFLYFTIGVLLVFPLVVHALDTYPAQIMYQALGQPDRTYYNCKEIVTDYPGGTHCPDQAPTIGTDGWCGRYFAGSFCSNIAVHAYLGCPSGGSLSGTTCINAPPCIAPATRQSDGTCKDNACPDSSHSYGSGLFDMGTSTDGASLAFRCTSDGCGIVFTGASPSNTAIVNGVRHYYAKGRYDYSGGQKGSCTPTSSDTPPPQLSDVPPDTCGAGQGKASMNGKSVCIDSNGNTVDDSKEKDSKRKETDKGDGSGKTSEETETKCDGKDCTTAKKTTNPDGSSETETTKQDQKSFCAENPESPLCKDAESGEPSATSELYKKGSDTVSGVFSDFTTRVKGAGFFSASSSFFSASIPSGSCGGMNATIDVGWGHSFYIDLDSVFCGSSARLVYSALGVGLSLVAAWLAFKIALL